MNVEELRTYCLSVKGATESFPFATFARGAENVLVFKVMEKMFLYIDLFPQDGVFYALMKCNPEKSQQLQQKYDGIIPSTRNPERNWIAVALQADVPDKVIEELITHSVEEVIKTLSKKKQQEYWGE